MAETIMKIKVSHENTYSYNSPVFLESHIIRLYPRNNPNLIIKKGGIKILPEPQCITNYIDTEGNSVTQVWFNNLTTFLTINSNFEVETLDSNPFDFCTDPLGLGFPFEYDSNTKKSLEHYLEKTPILDQDFLRFIDSIEKGCNQNVITFLIHLTQALNEKLTYKIREEGESYLPEYTFKQQIGTCRDFTVLFIEICRQKGLASRFVSGYKYNEEPEEKYYLHSWAEVYVPGGGWRGFDPTAGIAVDENYIPLAASYNPQNTTPILGHTRGNNIKTSFETGIDLRSQK
ncbi:MAG: transglutaminase family protein [Candidatus Gastranaerophilaceae bacterium]|jgi:transglutaminase-like putative cysteine protease